MTPMEKCIQNIETCSPGICNTIFLGPLGPGGPTGPIFAKSWASQLVGRYWVYKHPPKKLRFWPPKNGHFFFTPRDLLRCVFGPSRGLKPDFWGPPHPGIPPIVSFFHPQGRFFRKNLVFKEQHLPCDTLKNRWFLPFSVVCVQCRIPQAWWKLCLQYPYVGWKNQIKIKFWGSLGVCYGKQFVCVKIPLKNTPKNGLFFAYFWGCLSYFFYCFGFSWDLKIGSWAQYVPMRPLEYRFFPDMGPPRPKFWFWCCKKFRKSWKVPKKHVKTRV